MVDDFADHADGLHCRLCGEQDERCERVWVTGTDGAIALALFDRSDEDIEDDALTGAEPVDDVRDEHFRVVRSTFSKIG